jgi:hypothetical protein
MKVKFRLGKIRNVFKIIPTIQIEWNPKKDYDFAIVLAWLRWGVGYRFTKTIRTILN